MNMNILYAYIFAIMPETVHRLYCLITSPSTACFLWPSGALRALAPPCVPCVSEASISQSRSWPSTCARAMKVP